MENIIISFRNNEKEFSQAMRIYYNRTLKVRFDLGLGLAAILGGLGLWVIYGYANAWLYLIGTGLFVLLVLGLVNYVVPIIRFRQEPKYQDEYFLTFSDHGIDFKTEHLDSTIDWTYYNKVWESDKLYFLIYGKHLFTLIPKRVFTDDTQELAFRKLIQAKSIEIVRV